MFPLPRYFIFDLDGTLFDTGIDLARSVNFALAEFKLPTHDLATVISFIGNGSLNLIRRSTGEEGEHAVHDIHQCFLSHYLENCTLDTQPYPGVLEFLKTEVRASILTNKPDAPTRKILAHFGLAERFETVFCGDTTPARKPQPDGLLEILRRACVESKDALMVGDDLPDLGAALAAHVPSMALLGGFGNRGALLEAKPTFSANSFADFSRLMHA